MGGENFISILDYYLLLGSSPRGRGKPSTSGKAAQGWRLIPAWAGKTAPRGGSRPAHRAHPRVGGENSFQSARAIQSKGSSPRGRGKQGRCGRGPHPLGLIPAWAGKTASASPSAWTTWAHPRVGGENQATLYAPPDARGSSPRGRGKPVCEGECDGSAGLIPAWAGKTSYMPLNTTFPWAHPRVGGENGYLSEI